MNCEYAKANAVLYCYDELPDDVRHELDQHIQRCPECAAEVDAVRRRVKAHLDPRAFFNSVDGPNAAYDVPEFDTWEEPRRPKSGPVTQSGIEALLTPRIEVVPLPELAPPREGRPAGPGGRTAQALRARRLSVRRGP